MCTTHEGTYVILPFSYSIHHSSTSTLNLLPNLHFPNITKYPKNSRSKFVMVFENVVNPAQVWVAQKGASPPPDHVSPDVVSYMWTAKIFFAYLEVGDTVRFNDARGKQSSVKISKKFPVFNGVGFMVECTKTCYVQNGTELLIKGNKKKSSFGCMVDVPPTETLVRLRIGDLLIITRDSSDEQHVSTSLTVGTARVSCFSGYLFDSVKPEETIAFDDGKIWGVIKGTSISEIVVSITCNPNTTTKLDLEFFWVF